MVSMLSPVRIPIHEASEEHRYGVGQNDRGANVLKDPEHHIDIHAIHIAKAPATTNNIGQPPHIAAPVKTASSPNVKMAGIRRS